MALDAATKMERFFATTATASDHLVEWGNRLVSGGDDGGLVNLGLAGLGGPVKFR
jgi:hypothetical protein